MRIESGYLSPHFVTDPERMECVYEDCYVLVRDARISDREDLSPLLEKVAETGKPLLVVADDVEGEALASLVVKKVLGTIKCVAVRCPRFGDGSNTTLEEVAAITKGRLIVADLGRKLDDVTLMDLGHASRIVVNAETTILEPVSESKI